MKYLMLIIAIAVAGCGCASTEHLGTQQEMWISGQRHVVVTDKTDFQGMTQWSGYAYAGYRTPCTWKALQVEPGRWLVSMESTGRTPPLTQEFEATGQDLGEKIGTRIPNLP